MRARRRQRRRGRRGRGRRVRRRMWLNLNLPLLDHVCLITSRCQLHREKEDMDATHPLIL
jgi:hypothetical protein